MISFVALQIECRENNIKLLQSKLKEEERQLVLWQRYKWWLEHPEVAYFTARTSWETERWALERYLDFYVESAIGIDGSQLDFQNRGWFVNYPTLEEDVQDDDAFMIYRNPFLCT